MVRDDVPDAPAMDAGLNWQLAPLGSPTQERVTEPLEPNDELTVTVDVAEPPAVTVAGDRAEAASAKPAGVVFKRTATPTEELSTGTGRRISGRPSPFISVTTKVGKMPLLFSGGGISIREPKVPSPFPNVTATFTE
jgi:hypothetical protein